MSRRNTLFLALTLVLAACQTLPVPTSGRRTLTPSRRTQATPAIAAGSVAPSPSPALLVPTSGPTSLLSGLAQIDASYVIAAGGGNVIAAGGGNVIAAGGGNVIAAGGGNVIAAGGGNVIAAGGGNVIAAGGGNVIAAGGGNVIAAGGGNYRLLDFASGTSASTTASVCAVPSTSPGALAFGTVLPIQGLMIVPVSLQTGQVIGPAVFTDAQGNYNVAVPQGTESNVLLIAGVPGKSADDPVVKDPRLHFDLMVAPQTNVKSALNENTALATEYLRQVIRDDVVTFVLNPDAANKMLNTASGTPNVTPAMAMLIPTVAQPILTEVTCAKVLPANLPSLADRCSDIIWGNATVKNGIDINTMPTMSAQATPTREAYTPSAGDYALPAVAEIFARISQAAKQKLVCDPGFFQQQNLTKLLYEPHKSLQPGAALVLSAGITRPSDMVNFILEQYLVGNALDFGTGLSNLLDDLGLPDGAQTTAHLGAIAQTLVTKLGPLLLQPAVRQQFTTAIDTFGTVASGTCAPASP